MLASGPAPAESETQISRVEQTRILLLELGNKHPAEQSTVLPNVPLNPCPRRKFLFIKIQFRPWDGALGHKCQITGNGPLPPARRCR